MTIYGTYAATQGILCSQDEAELFSKATNIVVNSLGIIGLILGLYQIQVRTLSCTETLGQAPNEFSRQFFES